MAKSKEAELTTEERALSAKLGNAKNVQKRLITYLSRLESHGEPDFFTAVHTYLDTYSQDVGSDGARLQMLGTMRAGEFAQGRGTTESYLPETAQGRAMVIAYIRGLMRGVEDFVQCTEVALNQESVKKRNPGDGQ